MRGFFDISKNYNKDWFVSEVRKKFGDKFTFGKTQYINIRKDVTITCKLHGDFIIRPFAIIRQNAYCKKCKFIDQATEDQQRINKFTQEYKIVTETYRGNSKPCKIKNIFSNEILVKSPNDLICKLSEKHINQINREIRIKKRDSKLKLIEKFKKLNIIRKNKEKDKKEKYIIKHPGYDLTNVITIKKTGKYFLKNVLCTKHSVSFDVKISTFNNSKSHGCSKCVSEIILNNNTKRTKLFIDKTHKIENLIKSSIKYNSINFDKSNFFKNNIYTLNCSKHGKIKLSGKIFNLLINSTSKKHICNGCYLQEYNVGVLHPEILKDWDYTKNKILPQQITKGSAKSINWKCHRCHNNFNCVIKSKLKLSNGCPHCSLKTSSKIERIIFFHIKEIFGEKYVTNNERIKFGNHKNDKFSYDILITNVFPNLVIEYDGSFFHKNKLQYDINKNIKINKAGYASLRIRENPLVKTQAHDLMYEFIAYDNKDFDKKFSTFFYGVLLYIKNNFTYNKDIGEKIEDGLKTQYKLCDIPKGYFLYPILGKSLFDFNPELEPFWDIKKNKITLKQVSKSDPNKKWWKCENCPDSFLGCIKPVINKIKNKNKLICKNCIPKKIYIPHKSRLPFTNDNVSFNNGIYYFTINPVLFKTTLIRTLRKITRSYVLKNCIISNSEIEFDSVKLKEINGKKQFKTEKSKCYFKYNKLNHQIQLWL